MISLTLPLPPSTNGLFATYGNRRIRTRAYEKWISASWAALAEQSCPSIAGSYNLALVIQRPDNRKRDLSNYIKAVEDMVVKAGIVEDDSLCATLHVSWSTLPPAKPGAVTVLLWAV